MANKYTKAAKAKRSDAAKRAWVTIRKNKALGGQKAHDASAKQIETAAKKSVAKVAAQRAAKVAA